MGNEYVTLRLPKELVDEIDELMKNRRLGFKSRAEVTKEALRKLLQEYKEA